MNVINSVFVYTVTFLSCNPESFLYVLNNSFALNKLHEIYSNLLANINIRLYFNNTLSDRIIFIGHSGV